jgi:hypothetical protein
VAGRSPVGQGDSVPGDGPGGRGCDSDQSRDSDLEAAKTGHEPIPSHRERCAADGPNEAGFYAVNCLILRTALRMGPLGQR